MHTLSRSRIALVSLVLLAVVAATVVAEMLSRIVSRGLAQSASVRVAQADVCVATADAHFVGCSSIL